MNPTWKVGNVKRPSCMIRVLVKLSEKTRKENENNDLEK